MPRTHEQPTSVESSPELTAEQYELARTALDSVFANYQLPEEDQVEAVKQFESDPAVQREMLEFADPSLARDDSEDFKIPEFSE